MCKQGKAFMPNWMFGVMPHQHMFDDWNQMLNYISDVNLGYSKHHYNRWRFFDFEKVYG